MTKLEILQFSASWCGPCKAIKPFIEELKVTYSKMVDFKYIDVDEEEELTEEYEIQGVPTFVFIKDKKVVEKLTGANKKYIVELIEKLK